MTGTQAEHADAQVADGYARTIEEVRDEAGAKVLVVGCMARNFGEPWASCPKLEFWSGDEAEGKEVPKSVRLVLATRFMSHASYRRLRAGSGRHAYVFNPQALGTGMIKAMLQPLVAGASEEAGPTVTAATGEEDNDVTRYRDFGRGELQSFVTANLDRDGLAQSPTLEATRLQKLAREAGYSTTVSSVRQVLYRKAAAEREEPAPVHIPPAADDDGALLKMLDDAAATISLVREAIAQRSEARRRQKEVLAQLMKDI